jgi:hypothetical protein
MNASPTTYAIRVDGHLDGHWSAWLGDLDMTRDDEGTTTIATSAPSSPNSAPPVCRSSSHRHRPECDGPCRCRDAAQATIAVA